MTVDGMSIWLFDGRGQARGLGEYQDLRIYTKTHQSVLLYPTIDDFPEDFPCETGTGKTLDGQVYVLQNDITAHVIDQDDD